jgi:cytochrome c-type biogenesis protein CcmH
MTATATTTRALSTGASRRLRGAWRGLPGWIALAVIAIVTLAIGSIHPPPSAASVRIAHLDGIIKCPSCDNLSIADSNAATARALRAVVASDVRAGDSDAQIEAYVVSRYGAAILLSPTDPVVWIVPIVALAGSAVFLVVFLVRRGRRSPAVRGRQAAGGTAPDGHDTDQVQDEELVTAALAARNGVNRDG